MIKGNNNSKANELDVVKHVAAFYSKQAHLKEINSTDVVKENFRKVYRVYNAFCKYLKSQVQMKDKMVDTLYIGHFQKSSDSDSLTYFPSESFLEDGRFKYKQSPDQANIITQAKEKNQIVTVSISSLAMVCELQKDQVHKILSDIFSTTIDLGRKSKTGLTLNLLIGYLHISNKGELIFESKPQNEDLQHGLSRRVQSLIRRDDESVIDNASAILSQNGKTFSIKSDYIENLSVKTPATGLSRKTAHSIVSNDRRLARNHARAQSQGGEKTFHTKRGSNSINLQPQTQPLSATTSIAMSSSNQNSQQSLPYPFLQAFIERRTGQRFGKKTKFEHPDHNKMLLGDLQQQMARKLESKHKHKQDQLEIDKQQISNLNSTMQFESSLYQTDKQRKRDYFISGNNTLKQEKLSQQQQQQMEKMNERIDYFPFTHGDDIEHQRKIMAEKYKHDLKQSYQEIVFSSAKKNKTKSLLGSDHQSTNDSNDLFAKTSQGFLRGHKAYAFRQKDTTHLELTMNDALQRYEQQLREEEKRRQQQAEHFQRQVQNERDQHEATKLWRHNQQQEAIGYLEKQIALKEQEKEIARQARLVPEATNGGPEEDERQLNYLTQKRQTNMKQIRESLELQMESRKRINDVRKSLEQSQEQEYLREAEGAFKEEQEAAREKNKMRKGMYRQIWMEQMKLNTKAKEVDNIFN